jgi:hypothetical protein
VSTRSFSSAWPCISSEFSGVLRPPSERKSSLNWIATGCGNRLLNPAVAEVR